MLMENISSLIKKSERNNVRIVTIVIFQGWVQNGSVSDSLFNITLRPHQLNYLF